MTPPDPAPNNDSGRGSNPGGRSRFVRRAVHLLTLATVATLGLSVASVLADRFWIGELACHFCLPIAAFLGMLSVVWLTLGRRGVALLALGAALFDFARVAPHLLVYPSPKPPRGSTALRVFFANVLYKNDRADLLLTAIDAADPDIVVLAEIGPAWEPRLSPLRAKYPYRVRNHTDDFFGVFVLSRRPIISSEDRWLVPDAKRSSVRATIDLGDRQEFTVLATHPWPPSRPDWWALRDWQLRSAARWAKSLDGPVALVGDCNATPLSPIYADVEAESGLSSSLRGYGWQATWPASWPTWLALPLDHAFVSPQITVVGRRVGPNIGSDHLPVIYDLAIRDR